MNQLDRLKQYTKVVADTGDFEAMKAYQPQDATTNPSLILKAVQQDAYRELFDQAVRDNGSDGVEAVIDALLIAFGLKILEIVPGRVSTEVDARLSFDTEGTVGKARQLIGMYEAAGIDRERVLIKIASTWEGIRAAEILGKEGINCNLTLLFSFAQAIGCAQAKVQLISPFVGRIYDWYKKENGRDYEGAEDPGVQSVERIYTYFKKHGVATEVMGASFRNTGQVVALAGCDLLTIGPDLLEELQSSEAPFEPRLDEEKAKASDVERVELDEISFRYQHNSDAMGVEKLAEGIRKFAADTEKLEDLIREAS